MPRPEWFISKDFKLPPSNHNRLHFRKKSLASKTILSISHFFSEAFFSEEYCERKGVLQGIDPRVKVVSIVSLIISLTFIHKINLLIGWYVFSLILALFSQIKLRFFLTRVWIFIPFFTVLVALPALFNIFVPGEAIFIIKQFHNPISIGYFHLPDHISITRQGTISATLLILRAATSVSFVVLLILTTKWFHLIKALSFFKVPKSFVLILTITYRYIHLLLKSMEEMHMAFLSRILKKPSLKSNVSFTASGIHTMLRKSLATGEKVYAAMRSKGFTGQIKVMDHFRLGYAEAFFLLIVGAWIIGSLYLNSFA